MKLTLVVKPLEGDPIEVVARFADFVAFERTWSRSVARLESEMRLTDIAWLAWHGLKRTNRVHSPFDPDWINTVEEVTVKEDDPSVPLDQNPPTR